MLLHFLQLRSILHSAHNFFIFMKKIKVFVDSCNPTDTQDAIRLLGTIDGQTTNPTLLTKNLEIQKFLATGKKLQLNELLKMYKEAIQEIEKYTSGAISVEVYADWETKAENMLEQAEDMKTWGKNIYLKFPTIPEGLKAARAFTLGGGRVNMTLVFDTYQAAAVYSATRGTSGTAFVSPFVGRWDDRGFYGLGLIKQIRSLYDMFEIERNSKTCHVEILSASLRNLDHILGSIALGADILTAPMTAYKAWAEAGKPMPETAPEKPDALKDLPNPNIEYDAEFTEYKIDRSPEGLLNQGLTKFANDWNSVIEK